MRRNNLIIQLIIWSIILVAAGVTLAFGISSELTRKVFLKDEKHDSFEKIYSKEIAIEQLDKIDIDLTSQRLNIYSTGNTKIEIEHTASRGLSEREQLIISREADRLTVRKPKRIRGFNITLKEEVNIYIPKEYNGELEIDMTSGKMNIVDTHLSKLAIEKTSGATDIRNIDVQELEVDITSGALRIQESNIDNLNGSGTSGSVRIEDIISQSIVIGKTSGNIKVEGTCKEIDINSTSGGINVSLETMPDKIKIVQTSGSSRIELPENEGFKIQYSKTSGSLNSEFELNGEGNIKKGGTYVYKDGSSKIDIKGISGSTHLLRR